MTKDLVGEALPRDDLTTDNIARMYDVFQDHFENTSQEIFRRDLDNKNWVILLRDADSMAIQGFSTLACYKSRIKDKRVGVVYSGDTIIRPAYWGTFTLPRTWIRAVLGIGEQLPEPLYWLLISSGYKTYRFLPVFFTKFYPRFDRPTPPQVQEIMDHLAGERFGSDYDPALGIVRFSEGATPLQKGVAQITDRRLKNPHVAFFVARNPGHVRGDELVCLTEIRPDNFRATGRRMVQ
jgi:hypothetical protein